MYTLEFEARGGTIRLTTREVRQYVWPYLRHPHARSLLASIVERADEVRKWDLSIPDAPDAEEELVAQIVRAGGPAISRAGRPIRMYSVEVSGDETYEREATRHWSDAPPEVGEVIEAGGMVLNVENVLPSPDSALLECSRVAQPVA
jgi:hypothetical protein